MTQATDLANIQNQLAQPYCQRVNANFQAVVTQHYGATEPAPMLPNMIWFSSGDGLIKVRNPTNSGWQTIGVIGPPMKWTNVDIPSTAWRTGDIKPSFNGAEAGWVVLDDGTIGDALSGATNRPNPDTWPLYSYLWPSGGMYVFQPGTWTPVGKGASAAADFNAHRHLSLPRVCGRAMAAAGQGRSVDATKYPGGAPGTPNLSFAWWTDFNGAESVVLNGNQIPGHYHSFGVPDHGHPYCIDTTGQNSLNTHGAGGFPTSNGGANQARGPYTGWPTGNDDNTMIGGGGGFAGNTGWAGNNEAHTNIGPRFYCHLLCKL